MSVPDAYDQFEAHERKQQAWLESLPVCDYCHHPIQDENFYLINGENICPDCLDEHFKKNTDDFINN